MLALQWQDIIYFRFEEIAYICLLIKIYIGIYSRMTSSSEIFKMKNVIV